MKNKILALFSAAILGVTILVAPAVARSEKVTICHAAGLDGTTKYVTLTISENAVYKAQGGHFYENGTPRAGHEEDYFGPCLTSTQSPTPTGTTTPSPTPVSSGTPTPSESPSPSVAPTPTPSTSPTPTPRTTFPPEPSPSLTPTPSVDVPGVTLPPTDTVSPEVANLANVATSALILWIALTVTGAFLAMFVLLYVLRRLKG